MKYIFMLMFILLGGISVSAECTEITYYSSKAYKDEYLYIDTSFSEQNDVSINSDNIITKINALGTRSHPLYPNSNVLIGNQTKQVIYDGREKPHFSISFSTPIKISELEFNINGFNSKGESISKSIYLEGNLDPYDVYTKARLLKSTNDTNNIIINIDNVLVNTIYIFFDSYNKNDVYQLNYFQINKYQAYKHDHWTKNYINNTDTYKETICLNTGKFSPNGNNKYKYEDYTNLLVDSSLISNYKPVLKTSSNVYDFNRGNYNHKYSKPMSLKYIDKTAINITDFIFNGLYFQAINKNNEPYFRINNRQVVEYTASPAYWSQSYGKYIVKSHNTGWCYHVTGNSRTPCYKYNGHNNNGRLNVYDVTIRTYDNNVLPENQVIKNATYYLLNKQNNTKTKLYSSNSSNHHFHLNKTGIYTIYGELEDNVGNTNTIESNLFYIDQLNPSVMFNPNINHWTNNDIRVNIIASDTHSGVKDIRYKLNDNPFNIYNNNIIINKEGITTVTAHVTDNVLNETIKTSIKYKLDKTAPTIEFSLDENLKIMVDDELSKLKYFQYAISYDAGNTYSQYSNHITTNTYELQLPEDASIRVKVVAYDNANNKLIKESELYETYNSIASIDKLFSYSYDKNIETNLLTQIMCTSCKKEEQRTIKLYLNNSLYNTSNITLNPDINNLNLKYKTNNDSTNIKLEIYKEDKLEATSKLNVYSKSNRYILSYDNILFNEVVASYIEINKTQINYHENLTINTDNINNKYYQGQGIQVQANINYTNECSTINNFICTPSNILNNHNIYTIFDNGTIPIKDNYLNNNLYYINMHINNNILKLPNVYVDKYTGNVYKDKTNNLIDGYNRWYLDKELPLGTYEYKIQSKSLAFNNLSFDIIKNYTIYDTLDNQYNVRFIDPTNPYLESNSIWNNNEYKNQLSLIK